MKGLRVMMTGGGTGGLINPAIAIANTIRMNMPDAEIVFVGTPEGRENKLVPREGYELKHVRVKGIRRSLSPANIEALYLALTSPLHAKKLIKEFQPDVVIGTGGYVSWPLLRAAAMMHVPGAVHESNVQPGMAVRKLAPYVDRIYTNFEETAAELEEVAPGKILRVGNPLRGGFAMTDRDAAKRKLGIPTDTHVVLSFGGSLGAEAINRSVLEMVKSDAANHPDVMYIHAWGDRYREQMGAEFEAAGLNTLPNLRFDSYIYDMPTCMAAADLVISRAGAMTVSEIAMLGRAAILVPSPNVVANHQYKNAKALADKGAAVLLEESNLAGQENLLGRTVLDLLADDALRGGMEKIVTDFALGDANRRIYEDVLKLTGRA